MKKIILIILSIIGILVVAVILAVLLLVWLLSGGLEPNPPKPKITNGEFPFKLVYELNGERITVEDTLICEYDGVGWNEGMGKHHKWKGYLKSNEEESNVLLTELEDGTKVYYAVNQNEYYMGVANKPKYTNYPFYGVFVVGPSRSELHMMDIHDMLEYLNIVFIEWEESPPIVNEFK